MLKLTSTTFRSFYHHMKPTSSSQHSIVISLLSEESIICQITTGKLDNAVQATQFINNILSSPVTPQTVRNALKSNDFHSVIKQKHPLLKKIQRQHCLN